MVPQFCMRFNDIDNVGITGAHYTGFVMIGQHAFMKPEDWDQTKYFSDIHRWLTKGLGLPTREITYHEDAWAGGGNFGPCMEYFSRGLELGNQVYMLYEQTPSGPKELSLKVLDMGMGHERNAWFTQAKATSYETTFPTVCRTLFAKTGIRPDPDIIRRFLPYASYLNVDEIDDLDKEWTKVAKLVGMDVKELKDMILPLSAVYSVGEHARSLLFALSDGALPSNVGGGYNLRVILRRALGFIDRYGWDLDLPDIAKQHARYLKPIFPEVSKNLDDVENILEEERRKFIATKEKSARIVEKIIDERIDDKRLLQLYDSNGIPPEMIVEAARKQGKIIRVPDNFYGQVAELHEKTGQVHATQKEEKLPLEGIPPTRGLYFDDYLLLEGKGKVLRILGNHAILDQTIAYPTSGGQLRDQATLNGQPAKDIFKQGGVIIHELEEKPKFKEGDTVEVKVDKAWRTQLAQHHTATHIVNAAAKKVLGGHINQAGAKKTREKATLDITHFRNISEQELKQMEEEANRIVKARIPIQKGFYPRTEAEKTFGMGIYQGGAVPGKLLRIVNIPGIDVEACGGTHLNNTGETGTIRIEKANKISDGVVRLTFTAGEAAASRSKEQEGLQDEIASILGCRPEQVVGRAKELFQKWKQAKKARKKGLPVGKELLTLTSTEESSGDVILQVSDLLRTQPAYIPKTLRRFKSELQGQEKGREGQARK
ncbi:MAG: alanine--tRNA ligase [DPANN group archaeon]|nr:alanine--tRNA ligase [DPANN group archaeon]